MITMQEIAVELGISQTTVSCVLNERYKERKISEKTAEKIREFARKKGYQPNELAVSMVKGKSNVIGFIAQNLTSEQATNIMIAVANEASAANFHVKLINCPHDCDFSKIPEICLKQRLAGVVCYALNGEWVELLRDRLGNEGRPIALTDNIDDLDWGIQVRSDDELGAAMGVQHLIDLGHRRVAHVTFTPDLIYPIPRKAGFLKAMRDNDLPVPPSYLVESGSFDEVSERVEELLMSKHSRPSGFLTGNSHLAMIILQVAARLGLRAPEDFSLIAYGNHSMLSFAAPPITSVKQNHYEMGALATRYLFEEINQNKALSLKSRRLKLLDPELVVRKSTSKFEK